MAAALPSAGPPAPSGPRASDGVPAPPASGGVFSPEPPQPPHTPTSASAPSRASRAFIALSFPCSSPIAAAPARRARWQRARRVFEDPKVVDVQGLVQQSFVTAFESLDRYTAGRDLGAWLRGIARNLVREELRRSSRESHRLQLYRDYLAALYADEVAADDEAGRLERALRRCRERLTATAARALALHYEQGLGLAEVAQAIGRTVVATRQLLFRTRTALRLCVEAAGEGAGDPPGHAGAPPQSKGPRFR
jgi:RNA polymerase sigma-70 factor (ECF subfamily)